MNEGELMRIGFFEIEVNPTNEDRNARRFQLYENYNGVFLRIIVSMQWGAFVLEHMYFNSPKAEDLRLELFGTDLSVENIINKIKEHRKNIIPPDQMPESF